MLKNRLFFLLVAMLCVCIGVQAGTKKVALITGASRGVGLATAKYLASQGFTVYGTIRGPMALIYLENIHFLHVDLTSEKSIHATVETVFQREGRLDVLINNAGSAIVGPIELISSQEMQEQMQVNFFAPIHFIQAVLPIMRKANNGHIINISSINAFGTPPFGSLYAASKAALESFSESLCVEVRPFNIAISIVEPGLLTTRFSIAMGTRDVQDHPYQDIVKMLEQTIETRVSTVAKHPFVQTPEEIAAFLYAVIEDPHPKLRYQTSECARKEVAKKLIDLDGDLYLQQVLDEQK